MGSLSMVEIAAKQRHVLLLKKVRNNQPLSAGELKELKGYEEQMAQKKKTRKSAKKTAKKAPKKTTRRSCGKKATADVLTAEDIEAAWGDLTGDRPAAEKHAEMMTLLAEMAEVAMPPATAAEQLGMSEDEFDEFLANNDDAASVWRAGRIAFAVESRRQLKGLMEKGNAAAIRQILSEFDERMDGAGDFSAVTPRQLEQLLGEKPSWVTNRQMHDGLVRNVDGTIDLAKFLPWYRKFAVSKNTFDPQRVIIGTNYSDDPCVLTNLLRVSRTTINNWVNAGMPRNSDGTFNLSDVVVWRCEQIGTRPEKTSEPVNTFQQIKTEKLRLEIEQARNNLLDRDRVMATQCVRLQTMVSFIDRKMATMPGLMAGMTSAQIATHLNEMFCELRRQLKEIPKEYELTDKQETLFRSLLETMAPETEDRDD